MIAYALLTHAHHEISSQQVCHEHYLQTQTYHMAINYVNRYLHAVEGIKRCEFQLLGTTALLIAAKAQEMHPPHAIELAELTLGACTAKQISEKELEILQVCLCRLLLLLLRGCAHWHKFGRGHARRSRTRF